MSEVLVDRSSLRATVAAALAGTPGRDLHTHLYSPAYGTPVANATGKTDARGLLLWEIDGLVTYHYLLAEVYRVVPASALPYDAYWAMSKTEQADHIWRELFVHRTLLSEACRGVLTTLQKLGLDPHENTLDRTGVISSGKGRATTLNGSWN